MRSKRTFLQNGFVRIGIFAWVMLCCFSSHAMAQEENSKITEVFEAAQKKCVKVYGAKLGREGGYATGIVISPEGEIVTAAGSFLGTENLKVVLFDGSEYLAEVTRRNAALQIAVLKIEAKTPEYFSLEQSAPLQAGDWALVISNAFRVGEGGEPLGMTMGVVSARTKIEAKRGMQGFALAGEVLLLDAITSNPGTAGGAIVSVEGKLGGLAGKILEDKNSGARVNYAIPIDQIVAAMKEVPAVATADGDLGPETKGPSSSAAKRDLGIRLLAIGGARGAPYVDRVLPGSEAAIAGVKTDDLIVSVAGKTVRDSSQFKTATLEIASSGKVVVEVKRKDQILRLELEPKVGGSP